ncbi:MAG: hypothetical protein JRI55_39930 [Deltaproteobacteria bacterium]|jgi:hypothetical protein|nr:hypothetical protein [Deltaproteobacteria bacterium]
MKEIDFYGLPRPVQDRLLAALGDEFDPQPILLVRGGRGLPTTWLGVSAVAAVLLIALWTVGFGSSASALARHPLPFAAAYVVLTGALVAGLLQLLAERAALAALPYPAGIYLFSTSLIDARQSRLRVFPLNLVSEVTSGGPETIVVRFDRESFSLPVKPKERQETAARIRSAVEQVAEGLDDAQRQELDPLAPTAIKNPLSSDVPLPDGRPAWAKARWVITAVVALGGIGLCLARDHLSDASMFAAAKARDDVAAYEQYLARGTAHRTEVARTLLPRAALRTAVAEGTVDGIVAFRKAHPDTDIQPEVDAALRSALDTAFEAAQQKGSLSALTEFATRYPDHGLDQALAKATHGIYGRALERLRAGVPPESKQVAAFVGPLIEAIEKAGARSTPEGVRGPTVQVRMRRIPSRAIDGADDLVRRNPWFAGEVSFPSRYLADDYVAPFEQGAVEALAKGFGKHFDREIITFAPGKPLEEGTKKLPSVETPTLVVSYRVEPSGAGYASKKPRCVFVGLVFFFETAFLLPGGAEPLVLNHTAAMRIPSELIVNYESGSPRGLLEKSVYESMLRDGFAAGQQRYLAVWFGEPK